jgi:hypothetical protein
MLSFRLSREARRGMEHIPEPGRRLNVLTKAERRRGMFARFDNLQPVRDEPDVLGPGAHENTSAEIPV